MDIQVSSNLERLLFDLLDRDGRGDGRAAGASSGPPATSTPATRRGWWGARVDDDETRAVIAEHHERAGVLLDPHTAVGVGAVDRVSGLPDAPVVCLATAHPAKFPDAVESATGIRPPLPAHYADLFEREERVVEVAAELPAVQALVRQLIQH